MKPAQIPFDPKLFIGSAKGPAPQDYPHKQTFYKYKTKYFRRGLLCQPFTLKQIDSVNIKPTTEERERFLKIYDANCLGENDSTDEDKEEIRNFFKRDSTDMDLVIGDKIFITEGDL